MFLIFTILSTFGFSQNEDAVLFSVEDKPVQVSEFDYIYNKNNGDEANYTEKSLREYLNLYINFKLKVERARELKLDTITSLNRELDGYRKQLSNSYLVDNEVSDQLIKEVFERKKKDLRVSHIMVNARDTDLPDKAQAAKEKINKALELLKLGGKFEDVAGKMSEDKQSANRGGDIGFVSAMLPQGFYDFESAIYNLGIGETSEIIKSNFGYHIAKVTEERAARGEMEVAHILLRKKYKGQLVKNVQIRMDSIYQALQNGASFEEICKKHSQDSKTSNRGGYLGFFGINVYEKSFEEAAFALTEDNQLTKPFETKVGYHIVKRISKKDLNDFNKAQKQLKRVVSNSGRFEIARNALIGKIKDEGDFKEDKSVFEAFANGLNDDFFSFKWAIPELKDQELFSFKNGQKSSIKEFAAFCKKESKTRLRYNKRAKAKEAAKTLYDKYVTEQAIAYEESNLENKYPEFKALMREYREGILLFEATEREVWKKASSDTVGLEKFYDANRENYQWSERAKVIEYQVKTSNAKELKKIFKSSKKIDPQSLIAKFDPEKKMIGYKELVVDREDDKLANLKKWKVGEISKPDVDVKKNQSTFYKVVEILPKGQKKLSEARGYVISDYQDSLEKKWIADLKNKYKVVVNEEVFKSLIK